MREVAVLAESVLSVIVALNEPGGVVAGVVHRLHELGDADRPAIKKDRGLAAVEIDLDLMHAGVFLKGLLNREFALVTVHPFDAN